MNRALFLPLIAVVAVAACAGSGTPKGTTPSPAASESVSAAPTETPTAAPTATVSEAPTTPPASSGEPCGARTCVAPQKCLTVTGRTPDSRREECWIPCATAPCPAGLKCTMIYDGPGKVCVKD